MVTEQKDKKKEYVTPEATYMQPKKNDLIHVIDHVPKENNVLIYDNVFVHVRVDSKS